MDDKKRAAILSFAQAVFPVLQIFGIVTFTGDEVAAIMFLINQGLTLAALFIKTGQQPDTATSFRIAELEAEIARLKQASLPPMPY